MSRHVVCSVAGFALLVLAVVVPSAAANAPEEGELVSAFRDRLVPDQGYTFTIEH